MPLFEGATGKLSIINRTIHSSGLMILATCNLKYLPEIRPNRFSTRIIHDFVNLLYAALSTGFISGMKYLISIIPVAVFLIADQLFSPARLLIILSFTLLSAVAAIFFAKSKKMDIDFIIPGLAITILFIIHIILIRKLELSELKIPLFYFLLAGIIALSQLSKRFILMEKLLGSHFKLKPAEWHRMGWQWIVFCLVCGSLYCLLSILPFISVAEWPAARTISLGIIFILFILQQTWSYGKQIKSKSRK